MKLFSIKSLLALALTGASLAATAGEVVSDKLSSAVLGRSLAFTVYLPDGYYESFDKYPVVYLLHGSHGDEHTWTTYVGARETLDGLIRRGRIAPMIAVMPGGDTSWWIDGSAEKMQTALVTELIPYIEKQYEAQTDRAHRAVAGISMGGFGALNLSLAHPELMCAAGLLSPAVQTEPPATSSAASTTGQFVNDDKFDINLWKAQSYPALLQAYSQKDQTVPVYIESGDHDQQATPLTMAKLYAALYENQPKKVELRIVDGDHEWMTFRDAFPHALEYIQRQCGFKLD